MKWTIHELMDSAAKPEVPAHPHETRPVRVASAAAIRRAAALFRAAGDPARLALLDRLASGEFCVSELAAATKEGLSTISERLRLLRSEGLVERRRDGKHVYYALADGHVAALIRSAIDHANEPRPSAAEPEEGLE